MVVLLWLKVLRLLLLHSSSEATLASLITTKSKVFLITTNSSLISLITAKSSLVSLITTELSLISLSLTLISLLTEISSWIAGLVYNIVTWSIMSNSIEFFNIYFFVIAEFSEIQVDLVRCWHKISE